MSTVMTGTTSLYELAKTFWRTDLKAAGKSEKTIRNYLDAARQLDAFCRSNGMPVDPAVIRREHIAAFLADLRERTSASTEATRFRGLQQLFRWLHDDMGEIESNPMARMKPPKVEDRPVPIVSADDLRALFATCKGKTFENLRDAALMRMLLNTGPRIEEIMRLKLDDVDPASGRITVVGKGARIRYLYPTPIAMSALNRYLLARRRHRLAASSDLWLSAKGRFTDSGVRQMLERRCDAAGIARMHPHQFRHTWAHLCKSRGMNDDDLMTLGAWRSREMLARYGRSAADERA